MQKNYQLNFNSNNVSINHPQNSLELAQKNHENVTNTNT